MYDELTVADAALAELRTTLSDALAHRRLDKTQLATRSGLGRTTVSEAFKPGHLPSAATVAALARVLHLPEQELLDLQRRAAAGSNHGAAPEHGRGPGRPIEQWDPHDLEVHPASPAPAERDARAVPLPGYVPRQHDRALAQAVRDVARGGSRMLVLVGTSSTGKTRACWEAVQPLAEQGWQLWHPVDPTRADAALADLKRIEPRTVVWLNETQHYLDARGNLGERIAAALLTLLTDRTCGPVLILGTLWPEYDRIYSTLPEPGSPDLHPQARELLAGRRLVVPDRFDLSGLSGAAVLARTGDRYLAAALEQARDGRLAQHLAGAPELLHRYQTATPPARSLLQAAMDARRLGVGLHLPADFLVDAAEDYLTDDEFDLLTDDWIEQAVAELARPVHGNQAPLRRIRPRFARRGKDPRPAPSSAGAGAYRLADYLEQHGRMVRSLVCPPASFWHAAARHLDKGEDLARLAKAAGRRHRLQLAHLLYRQAADAGDTQALSRLAVMREQAGDRETAERLARRAADIGSPSVLAQIARLREKAGDAEGAERMLRRAADGGHPRAWVSLAWMKEKAGNREEAEELLQSAAEAGHSDVLVHLARMRKTVKDWTSAERFAQRAAEAGHLEAFAELAKLRGRAGDWRSAEDFAYKAADSSITDILTELALIWERTGDVQGAEDLLRRAADAGYTDVLPRLARLREKAGDETGAHVLRRQAANAGHGDVLIQLARERQKQGDWEGAEALLRDAAEGGSTDALVDLAWTREKAGDRKAAEELLRSAADAGEAGALIHLTRMRQKAGDEDEVESLLRLAVDGGHTEVLIEVARLREKAGDRDGAETLLRRAVDAGHAGALIRLARMYQESGAGTEQVLGLAVDGGHTEVLIEVARLREKAGDRDGAETLLRRAVDAGHARALIRLARMRDAAGDSETAMRFTRLAADAGYASALAPLTCIRVQQGAGDTATALWPHGLDPDDTPPPFDLECGLIESGGRGG